MKYVIFSDVHGNQYALRRMIADSVQNVQGYLYLGDTSGYYYGQKECMELLQSLPNGVLLRGNHDCNYQNSRGDGKLRRAYADKYGSSYLLEQGEEYLQWLSELKPQAELTIDGVRVGLFHGSPQDAENGRIYPDSPLPQEVYTPYDVVFQGHTHYRMIRQAGGTMVLNPGSLGQPRDGRGFSYCIFDFKTKTYEFDTVQFDKEALTAQIEEQEKTVKNKAYLISVLTRGDN